MLSSQDAVHQSLPHPTEDFITECPKSPRRRSPSPQALVWRGGRLHTLRGKVPSSSEKGREERADKCFLLSQSEVRPSREHEHDG